ncbi:hypothetical protein AAVH_27416 [Aphelenchoides avenae]|nr:hypothetical protein AAVH_27416 [Aphelenchus avenae]
MAAQVDREVAAALVAHAGQAEEDDEPEDGVEEPDGGHNGDIGDHVDAFDLTAPVDVAPVAVENDQHEAPDAFGFEEELPFDIEPADADFAAVAFAHNDGELAAAQEFDIEVEGPVETVDVAGPALVVGTANLGQEEAPSARIDEEADSEPDEPADDDASDFEDDAVVAQVDVHPDDDERTAPEFVIEEEVGPNYNKI